ncbi:unnamed protein product [Arabidopsis lyrata]|nr:unnamed protein product [Arabidopsis lyrata]
MVIPSQSYSFSGIVVTLYFFFLFSFVLHILASPTLNRCRHDQRDALLEFKHEFRGTMNSEIFNHMSIWNKSTDCCSWEAVTCDAKYGQVISLYLHDDPLNNTLKPNSGLFKLRYLQNLSLLNCKLYGEIPSSFGNLSHLTTLDLSNNELVGQVPASIGNLTQLSYNYFEPEFIPDMSRFHNLEYFDVSLNLFFGPFPSLQMVYLWRNNFTGPINFGNTSSSSNLSGLDLSDPFVTMGPIDFGNTSSSSNLSGLSLADNKFVGQIPEFISKFLNLGELDLPNNKLEGKVPGCLLRLRMLKLSHNSFSGFGKSSEVLDQPQMNALQLDSNSFRGPFPHWICEIISLKILDLSNNSFNGSIPPCLGNIAYSLQVLNLGNNNFSGILPDVFLNAANLNALDVSRNRLEGKLPKTLINLHKGVDTEFEKIRTDFTAIDFSRNRFYGKIPESIGLLKGLRFLNLSNNAFTSNIPRSLANMTNLETLDLSRNQLSGQIPRYLEETFSAFFVKLSLSRNLNLSFLPMTSDSDRPESPSFDERRSSNDECTRPNDIAGPHYRSTCTLQSLERLKELCRIPPGIMAEAQISDPTESPENHRDGYFCVYEIYFNGCGLTFPLPEALVRYLAVLEIALPQLTPNLLRTILGIITVAAEAGYIIGVAELNELLSVRSSSKKTGYFSAYPNANRNIISHLPNKDENWHHPWFLIKKTPASIGNLSDLLPSKWSAKPAFVALTLPSEEFIGFFKTILEGETLWNSFTLERFIEANHKLRMSPPCQLHHLPPPPSTQGLSSRALAAKRKALSKPITEACDEKKEFLAAAIEKKDYSRTLLVDDNSAEGNRSVAAYRLTPLIIGF